MRIIDKNNVLKGMEQHKTKFRKFGVRRIGLFGSFLKGKQNKKSDIDIIVKFSKPSFDNYVKTLILLEKMFKRKIDLITESSLRPELEYVKREAEYARI
jgi:predicted nucleotidyltransferase